MKVRTTIQDWTHLKKMRLDPPGTVRTVDERIAFEHHWDDLYDLGQSRRAS